MKLRSRIATLAVILAIAAWWGVARRSASTVDSSASPPDTVPGAPGVPGTAGAASPGPAARSLAVPRARSAAIAADLARPDVGVTIAGHVYEGHAQHAVDGVEVVFRSASGETSATTRNDGSYAIHLAPGGYGAFVRGDAVVSVARGEPARIPAPPSAEIAGIPDEALMTRVVAHRDTDGVDFTVMRSGILGGHVVDPSGRGVAGVAVRARSRGGIRPTLGTDIAESDDRGAFELRLPEGTYELDVSHPQFAGLARNAPAQIAVHAGVRVDAVLPLDPGCIISGRVVSADGMDAADGAIERMTDRGEFGAAGRIDPDGQFRWTTTEIADVALRAWPWKSPPSDARRFTCSPGARFTDVVFQLPDRRPDIEGVVVDRTGAPVSFTYVDLAPLDPGGLNQQERTDAAGHWEVYDMPPGRYRVAAEAGARGITSTTVVAPRDGVRLELGGTGRLEGTTTRLATGSFELVLGSCLDSSGKLALPPSRRVVSVSGGRFSVDDLPACQLAFSALWHGRPISQQADIPNAGTAHVELDLGPFRTKTVRGVIRDGTGRPVPDAIVTATHAGNADAAAKSDATGAYSLETVSGASLRASQHGRVGMAQVGGANIDAEQLDLVVEDPAAGSDPHE